MGDVLEGSPVATDPPPETSLLIRTKGNGNTVQFNNNPMFHSLVQGSRRQRLLQSLQIQFPLISSSSYPFIFPLYTSQDFDVVVSWTIPSKGRSGFALVTGLTLGAQHGVLNHLILSAEQGRTSSTGKKTRNMYAETTREKEALIASVRNSSWNVDEDPLVVDVQAADKVHHDFSKKPASILITFNIRNTSTSCPAEYTLLLNGDQTPNRSTRAPVPPFVGALTHRGTVSPLSQKSIQTRIWVVMPGTYSIAGWNLQCRPLPGQDEGQQTATSTLSSFVQDASVDEKVVIVMDIS